MELTFFSSLADMKTIANFRSKFGIPFHISKQIFVYKAAVEDCLGHASLYLSTVQLWIEVHRMEARKLDAWTRRTL